MTVPGRALGVDYGTKRVGIAVSDALGIAATAIEVIEETDPGKVAKRVAAIAKDRGVTTLVFGIPVNMDGSEHASHAKVVAFAEQCGRMSGACRASRSSTWTSASPRARRSAISGPPASRRRAGRREWTWSLRRCCCRAGSTRVLGDGPDF